MAQELISGAALALMPRYAQQAYLEHVHIVNELMALLAPERWPEIEPWLVTRSNAEARAAIRHLCETGDFPPPPLQARPWAWSRLDAPR